jgi:pilus assembly protein CpaE
MNDTLRSFAGSLFSRGDTTSVALVSPSRELQDRLREALKPYKQFEFAAILGNLSQVESHFGSNSRPSILIVDLQEDLASAIAAIESMRDNGFTGAIITLSDTLDEASIRGLLRLNVTDWLPGTAPTQDIIDACNRASTARKVAQREGQAKCITLVPAAGGVGTTTLAIETAFLIAEQTRNYKGTCIVDLNLQSSALADYLDLSPALDLRTIATEPDRLDFRLLEVMLSRHPSELAVLAAPRTPMEIIPIESSVLTTALSIVSDMFEHMILDLPSVWQPWTNDVLNGSDEIYIVTEFMVPALRKAHELRTAMQARLNGEAPVKIIVNKCRQHIFGGGLRKGDAADLLGEGLAGFIPDESDLVREAINRGEPLSVASRSNRVARELSRILSGA